MLHELVKKNRTVRRFHQEQAIARETLENLVDLARLTPSGANVQPLKYLLVNTIDVNNLVFPSLGWAGYLADWNGPEEGERPAAYIVILLDKSISSTAGCDHGLAAQTIMLGAAESGLGGCIIGSINRTTLQASLQLSEQFDILLVLALGVAKEIVRLEPLSASGNIRYYRSDDGVHHVPKRSREEIIINLPQLSTQ